MTTDNRASDTPQLQYDFFVFGDSLSDIGNSSRATFGLLPPSPPYFNGRFSNGPVAVETLAAQLGLPSSLSTNFAVGGAGTGRDNGNDNRIPGITFDGLLDQIDRFKAEASSLGAGAEDLYFIWAGANDLNQLSASDPVATVNTAVANIATAVTSLVQSGAKNIVVVQTPNLGRVPASLQSGRLQALTDLSIAFNAALESSLTSLENSLAGSNIILSNLLPLSEQIAQNPAAFGFTNTTSPYLNGLLPQDPAADPNQFFFWDLFHPTTRSHSLFADVFRNNIIAGITDDITRSGTAGADRLVSFSGNDVLKGLGGADQLAGGPGNDALVGGSQADILIGDGNRDDLTGGGGQDELQGGPGRDRFIYGNPNHGRDTITDFQLGKDILELSSIFRKSEYDRPNPFEAYVRLAQVNAGTVVRIDSNGNAKGGFKPLVLLLNIDANDLTASSFSL